MKYSKKSWYWIAQLGGWGLYFLLVALNSYNRSTFNINIVVIIGILYLASIAITHLLRNLVIRLGFLEINLWKLLPKVLIICFAGSLVMQSLKVGTGALIYVFQPTFEPDPLTFLNFTLGLVTWTILLILWNTVYFTFHFFRKSRNEEIKNLRLEAMRNEIELNNLKSQLNPHFMFNALNSIRALIEENPKFAKTAVTKLSNTLRNSLQMGKNNKVTIGEEIELIQNYSDIEKIRFEERLSVNTHVEEGLEQFLIPPLIIQTLVENAIKHGISQNMSGGEVDVKITENEGDLLIFVVNTGIIKSSNRKKSGVGITNAQKRIELTYGKNSVLELYDDQQSFTTTAKIRIKNYKSFDQVTQPKQEKQNYESINY